jgi:hypothetical protein
MLSSLNVKTEEMKSMAEKIMLKNLNAKPSVAMK